MKKIFILLLIISPLFKMSAQNLNQYEYVLVPETYEFTGGFDQYQLNSLTKFLFEKEGFKTLMTKENKPAGLKQNPCLAVNTVVENNSGIFVTKLIIKLKNCNGEIVFESREGSSREKDYKTAYHEALRDAFESVKELNYKYNSSSPMNSESQEAISESEKEKAEVAEINKKVQEAQDTEEDEEEVETKEAEVEKELTEPEPEEIQVSAIPGPSTYTLNGTVFKLEQNDKGFALYQENGTEPIALLVSAGQPGTYIYQSLANNGVAYFKNDRLIVEYYNTAQGKKVQVQYMPKSQ